MIEKIFLLGGYDLEMLEIKKLLSDKPDILVFDKSLKWDNSLLSAYADILLEYGNKANIDIFGIELRAEGVTSKPDNYHLIDHHNDLSERDSSIEQVANLLNIKLSRQQLLIAANDKGYINAMKQIGASSNEIEQIRLLDRQAQGVTEEDEHKAELSVRNKISEKGVVIVKSLADRFSPICDRLYPCDKLLIYNDKELVYYGKGKDKVVDEYSETIKTGRMYHGGGNFGFVGTAKKSFTVSDLEDIKNRIIQLVNM